MLEYGDKIAIGIILGFCLFALLVCFIVSVKCCCHVVTGEDILTFHLKHAFNIEGEAAQPGRELLVERGRIGVRIEM